MCKWLTNAKRKQDEGVCKSEKWRQRTIATWPGDRNLAAPPLCVVETTVMAATQSYTQCLIVIGLLILCVVGRGGGDVSGEVGARDVLAGPEMVARQHVAPAKREGEVVHMHEQAFDMQRMWLRACQTSLPKGGTAA